MYNTKLFSVCNALYSVKVLNVSELIKKRRQWHAPRSLLFTPPFPPVCCRHVTPPLLFDDVAFQLSWSDVDTRMWIHCEIFTGFHATNVANRQKWTCTGKICPVEILEVLH